MTREEAINKLVNARYADEFQGDEDLTTAHNMAIEALEIVEEFEKAQIISSGRLNGRTYAYKRGLEDGRKEQEPMFDKVRAEIEGLTYYCCEVHPRNVIDDVLAIIDKCKTEMRGNEE